MMTNPTRSPTDIASAAMTARPTSDLLAIFFPNQGGAWRVQLRENGKSEPLTLMVNDRSGAVSILEPLAGDRIAFWIRWLHEGSHAGEVWRFVVFLSGVIPAALGVTGILIWLRQRRQRALMATQSDRIPLPRASTSAAIGGITPAE